MSRIVQQPIVTRELTRIGGGQRERLMLACGHEVVRALRKMPVRSVVCPTCSDAVSER